MQGNVKKLRNILWIAPYPYEIVSQNQKKAIHPAPWITTLADEIKNECNLTIISFSNKINKDETIQKEGIKFVFLKTPNILMDALLLFRGTYFKLRKYRNKIVSEKYDLIHIHGTEHQYAYALRDVNTPAVISIQGLLHKIIPFLHGISYNKIRWSLLKGVEVSEIKSNKYFICRTHWDTNSISVINNKAKIFKNWEIIRSGFFNDSFLFESYDLIYLGGLVNFKGIKETLLAFREIQNFSTDFKLHICGSGTDEKLEKLLDRLNLINLKSNIIFHGKISENEILSLYKTGFCLIHPSYIDNSPNSVCEAQVCGLPTIAANVGGVSSLIENEVTGFLTDRYNYLAIAKIIERLKLSKELYKKISKNSRDVARTRHSQDNIANKTIDIYEKIIKE